MNAAELHVNDRNRSKWACLSLWALHLHVESPESYRTTSQCDVYHPVRRSADETDNGLFSTTFDCFCWRHFSFIHLNVVGGYQHRSCSKYHISILTGVTDICLLTTLPLHPADQDINWWEDIGEILSTVQPQRKLDFLMMFLRSSSWWCPSQNMFKNHKYDSVS